MKRNELIRIFGGILLIVVSVFVAISLVTFDPHDTVHGDVPLNLVAANKGGAIGAYVALGMRAFLGLASYLATAAALAAGVALLYPQLLKDWAMKLVGIFVLIPSVAATLHAIQEKTPIDLGNPGGIAGAVIGEALINQLGAGAFLLLAALVLAGLLLSTDRLVLIVAKAIWAGLKLIPRAWCAYLDKCRGTEAEQNAVVKAEDKRRAAAAKTVDDKKAAKAEAKAKKEAEREAARAAKEAEKAAEAERKAAEKAAKEAAKEAEKEAERAAKLAAKKEPVINAKAAPAPAPEPKPAPPKKEAAPKVKPKAEIKTTPNVGDPRTLESAVPTEYKLPPLELLEINVPSTEVESEDVVRERAAILERTLEDFNIEANVVEIDRGPVITQYEIEIAAGIKITKVAGLSDDLARALKAQSVRIVAPIPGKSTIGIEVPNSHRETVMLRELIESGVLERKRMSIPLLLGKDASGNPLVTDLAQMPHLLIAGATGSGKSVCINTLILSILMTQYPDNLKLILVDPKMVELSTYEEIPHLMCPVLTDMKRTAQVLDWATIKMDERYALFSQVGVRNLPAYNKLGESGIRERLHVEEDAQLDDVPTHLPMIVIIIDELADLMMTAAKEAEFAITRLAQKSRAVGIHIVMATQRPSVNVITGLIKANMPSRVAFQTTSMTDSRTILDKNGAEMLLGQGDLLFLPPGTSDLIRGQGAYASDSEIFKVADFWKQQGDPVYDTELTAKKKTSDVPPEERDDLYLDAVRVVLSTQRGSVSLLQRKLGVGYSRAARLVDMMAEEGIVGEYKGSQAREVMFTLDEWEKSNAADLGLEPDAEPGFDDDE